MTVGDSGGGCAAAKVKSNNGNKDISSFSRPIPFQREMEGAVWEGGRELIRNAGAAAAQV